MGSHRRKRKSRIPQDTDALSGSRANEVHRRSRKQPLKVFGKTLGVLLLLLAIAVWFLPTIVVSTPLKQLLIDQALSDFDGRVTVDSITCGWLTETQLTNVVATDRQGQVLLRMESLQIDKSLMDLIRGNDLGTLQITRPAVDLRLRSDGSNLEDAIAGMLQRQDEDRPVPAMVLSVVEGAVDVTDVTTGHQYRLEGIDGRIGIAQPHQPPLDLDIGCQVSDGGTGDRGSFRARATIDAGGERLVFRDGTMVLNTDNLPVAVAGPFITRWVEPVAMAGTISGGVQTSWSDAGATLQVQVESAEVKRFLLDAPQRLGQDRIRLEQTRLQGQLLVTPEMLKADQLVWQSEIGSLQADGQLNWEQLAAIGGASIPANNFQADGTVDVAAVAAMLPNLIPWQSDLQVESGTVRFQASSRVEGTDRRLVVNVESTGLTARRGTQRLNWDKPARVVAAVRQTSDNAVSLESLNCQTSFLTLDGSATQDRGEFRLQGDLKSAVAEVGQFLDLGDVRLEGVLDGNLSWQFGKLADAGPATSRPLQAAGRFRIQGPVVELPGRTSWNDEELNVTLQMAGQRLSGPASPGANLRLDSGKLELVSPRQSLQATLLQPVTSPSLASTWILDCRAAGQIETWLAQLAQLGILTDVDVAASGSMDATARLTLDQGNRLMVQDGKYELANFRFAGYGVVLDEPEVGGQATVDCLLDQGQVRIPDATVSSSSFSARARDVVVDTQPQQPAVSGQLAFLADIHRCLQTVGAGQDPAAVQWFGRAGGTVNLQSRGDVAEGQVSLKLEDLVAARFQRPQGGLQNVSAGAGTWIRLLEEKQLQLDSQLQVRGALQEVAFRDTRLTGSLGQVVASGAVSDLQGVVNCQIEGNWNPDWQRLKPLVDSFLDGLASLQGVQGGNFRLQGPLFHPRAGQPGQPWIHPELQVAAAASWQQGELLGLPVGASRLQLQLANGIADVAADPIPFSGGTMRLLPRLDLRQSQAVLTLPPGPLVENVELTPEVCQSWLRYAAPLLAGATKAAGRVSVATEQVYVPLGQWNQATVVGTAMLHQAGIGPGPLGQKLDMLVRQIRNLASGQPLTSGLQADSRWIRLPEQQVRFAVQDGRVIHQGLKIGVDSVVIESSGSVGLDQSMQLSLSVPILDEWLGSNRLTQGLRGRSLNIPVSGHITRPRIDGSLLQNLAGQFFQQAAGSAINQEIRGLIDQGNQGLEENLLKQLPKLFGGDK
jgi:hypothetical protein